MHTKQEILDEIKNNAEKNGGKPLGVDRFEKETGINSYNWGKYWARFGDAQKEAGFIPNQMQDAHTDEFLIDKITNLMRKLGKFPTYREIEVEKGNDANFPDKGAFYRWGTKEQFATKVAAYCKDKNGYDDIVKLCQSIFEKSSQKDFINNSNINQRLSEVYLFKSGHYYKIGRTNDTVRRGHEIRIQLPEKMDLIHSIKTDDPSGVESYWHKRFESKQMKGEWFDLNASDVKAFKRWRHIC